MKLKLSLLSLFASVALSVPNASAGFFLGSALLSWDTTGQPGDEASLQATVTDPNLQTGALNLLTRVGVVGDTLHASAPGTFYSKMWTKAFDQSNRYLTFTVAPAEGFQLTLDSLQFSIAGTNTAPNTGRWGYSIDGGASFVFMSDILLTSSTSPELLTWTFDTPLVTTEGVEFRFWAFGDTAIKPDSAVSGGGGIRLGNNSTDPDLVLNGTVQAIPEPSTYALLGLALTGLVMVHIRAKRLKAIQVS